MTLNEMIVMNRYAEKISELRITKPGSEAYALAGKLMEISAERGKALRERWPAHVDDVIANNIYHLMQVQSMRAVVDAAQEWFEDMHDEQIAHAVGATGRLIAATRNHNLTQHMPVAHVPEGEDPTP